MAKTPPKQAAAPKSRAKAATPEPEASPAPKPTRGKATANKTTPAVAAPKTSVKAKASSSKAPPPPPKAEVVTLKHLAGQIGDAHELSPRQAQAVMTGVIELLVTHLKAGDKLRLKGLGVLEVKSRPARTARNPATGAPVQVAASKKIAFRPAKELKEAI